MKKQGVDPAFGQETKISFNPTDSFADIIRAIPMTASQVLEAGCGDGLVRSLRRRMPLANFQSLGSHDVDHKLPRLVKNSSFDCIVLNGVLEQAKNSAKLLRNISRHLNEQATLVVCVQNYSHWMSLRHHMDGKLPSDPEKLAATKHYTLESIINLLRESGWHLIDARPIIVSPDQTRQALDALEPAAEALGINRAKFRQNAAPLQWIVRARRKPVTNRLTIAALGLRHQGGEGVSRVRTDHPLTALNSLPDVSAVWKSGELVIPKGFKPDILILQRSFLDSPALIAKVEEKSAQGTIIVSDYDDDPRHWPQNEAANFRAFRGVHAVTVSTEPLAELIRQWNPNVQVFPNAVFELPEVSTTTPKQGERIRIFFGALNRSDDWLDIEGAVLDALQALGDKAELVIVHDREAYDRLPKTIHAEFHPTLPHSRYMQVLGTCDLALLPLRDTEFNRFKSDIKFIECCAAGVVPIFSPTIYAERPEHHEIGIKADTYSEWEEALTQLATDPVEIARRRALGAAYALHERMQSQQAQNRFAFYERLRASHAVLEKERQARLQAG